MCGEDRRQDQADTAEELAVAFIAQHDSLVRVLFAVRNGDLLTDGWVLLMIHWGIAVAGHAVGRQVLHRDVPVRRLPGVIEVGDGPGDSYPCTGELFVGVDLLIAEPVRGTGAGFLTCRTYDHRYDFCNSRRTDSKHFRRTRRSRPPGHRRLLLEAAGKASGNLCYRSVTAGPSGAKQKALLPFVCKGKQGLSHWR
jgi:hypothetical protein